MTARKRDVLLEAARRVAQEPALTEVPYPARVYLDELKTFNEAFVGGSSFVDRHHAVVALCFAAAMQPHPKDC